MLVAQLLTKIEASPTGLSRALLLSLAALLLHSIYQRVKLRHAPSHPRRPLRRIKEPHRRPIVQLDKTLLRRIRELLCICFPHVFSLESGLMLVLTSLIVLRTTLTLTFSRISANNTRALVQKNFSHFIFGLFDLALYAIPATITSVGVTYTTATLEQRFRERLQNALHQEYFEKHKLHDLVTKSLVDNPAHRVTNDVQRFCSDLSGLLPAVLKPIVDITILSKVLAGFGGYGVPLVLMLYYAFVAAVFRMLLPNFADWVTKSREKEANLRLLHAQLVQHAEEVAFYRGAEMEGANAERLLNLFVRLEWRLKRAKWWSTFINDIMVKYAATGLGHAVCAVVVSREKAHLGAAALTELFVRCTQLYIPLSLALGKLLSLHLKVGALCGSAHRVGELRDVLAALQPADQDAHSHVVEVPNSDQIVFKDVTVISPTGQGVLLNFTANLRAGRHVLIMGCNGAGKTALLRTLWGLWPLQSGMVERPTMLELMLLTQRTYLPPGTLRTQLVYPAIEGEGQAHGIKDEILLHLAAELGLSGVVEREGGLDAEKEWGEVLSGGEQQRIALVRVVVHCPKFVFLDECTSAISQDVEPLLYGMLQRRGVTLITVSHRETLKTLHHEIVRMDGMGGYDISVIGDFQ
ncbi:adenosinetriphosphatase [Trypanosoma rangeli]|uniref:Adenosinetriphosphatase n=1 Tax=Trypanosoma rangeli TaxID=5698 RepID=A0A3R7NBD2_TRYRA|nr:adenosinetriphosphatase [Trypanosoma rangeli]RNE99962.1 adenosinetriphosphatase [Trypanosoma rangeli]|eukprot:RNE99962.1 adenosinetriphosphatase [Trypanosoma rangeli]